MAFIPIDPDDIPAGRALRTEFARFWSTEQGEPRDVYDRFISATPTADGVHAEHASVSAPGYWVRPEAAVSDRVILFLHGGGYGQGSAKAYIGFVSQIVARTGVAAFA